MSDIHTRAVKDAFAMIEQKRIERGCTCRAVGIQITKFDPACPAMDWHVGCCRDTERRIGEETT